LDDDLKQDLEDMNNAKKTPAV